MRVSLVLFHFCPSLLAPAEAEEREAAVEEAFDAAVEADQPED